jgi:hypothetical protein
MRRHVRPGSPSAQYPLTRAKGTRGHEAEGLGDIGADVAAIGDDSRRVGRSAPMASPSCRAPYRPGPVVGMVMAWRSQISPDAQLW